MSITRKVLHLAAHDMPADVHAGLHSLADAVAELERERDEWKRLTQEGIDVLNRFRSFTKLGSDGFDRMVKAEETIKRVQALLGLEGYSINPVDLRAALEGAS